MRGRTASCLCLLAIVASVSAVHASTYLEETIDFDPARLEIDRDARHGVLAVHYPGAVASEPAGAPDLPALPVWFEIGPGDRVTALEVTALDAVEIAAGVRVVAAVPDRRPGDPSPPPAAAAGVATTPVPWGRLGEGGALRGHRVVSVLVHPARWEPAGGRLLAARRLRIRLELASGGTARMLPRHRVVPGIEARFERALGSTIRGFRSQAGGAGGGAGVLPSGNGPAEPGPFQPTFRPTTDGSPVEYVIITSDAMAAEFQRLADWKTQKGVQTVVRTVEWIDQTYPNGVDRAERIRFFIRDAYQNWGTLWVLLGGDTDVVPPRYGYFAFLGGEFIPSDYYFACLDRNWNADGDDRFGEQNTLNGGGDDADFFGEVSVGRAPVSAVDEAMHFVDKTLLYETDAPSGQQYPASLLVLAERIFDNQHGADIAEQAIDRLPPWMRVVRLYEESSSYPGSIELTKQAAIDSLNDGFGVVLHVGHGFRNTMSIGDDTLNNPDADNLVNAPRNSVVFAIDCSSAAIDFNSIGERWVKNANGGAIGYIGTSRLAFVVASTDFQNAWFDAVFVDSVRAIGMATDLARLALVPQAGQDSAWRWNLLATTLLGDPETALYASELVPMEVTHAPSFTLGSGTMTVHAATGGDPIAGANVTLIRAGEAFGLAQTDAGGDANVAFLPQTAGDVTLTVAHSPYRFYQTTLPAVDTAGPFLHLSALAVDDDSSGSSSGDGDGETDAGETIELAITLRNGGGAGATSASATLTVDDPEGMVTILDDTVSYGSIGAGGQSAGSGSFVVAFDAATPVAYQPLFHLALAASQGSWSDVFVLGLQRPFLEHYEHVVDDSAPRGNGNGLVEAGEEIWYTITLRNTGQDAARGVSGVLQVVAAADSQPHPLVTTPDNLTSPGDIAVGATVTGDRLEFILDQAVDPTEILLEMHWSDDLGAVRTEYLDVIPPAMPDTVQAFGSADAITLRWQRPEDGDIKGYDVLRADNPLGPFLRINGFTADGSATYEDPGLPALTRYYYQVVARDSSYNQSVPSVIISGTTNPPLATGWPIATGQQSQSSIAFANTTGDEALELFAAADYQYGWHADATEILDGDGDDRTSGVYSTRGFDLVKGFSASTAIGDIDHDFELEIVNVGWTQDSVFVWDDAGQIVPGWPKTVLDDFNWPSPVLADLDGDAELEIIVWAGNGGRLFAWHADGTEVADGDNDPATDGVLYRVFGTSFNYSSPAVADIDGDPELEVIFCVNLSDDDSGKIYAINHDGTLVPGWPYATGTGASPSQITASPAVADVDGDGDYEIIVAADRGGGRVYVMNGNGSLAGGWPRSAVTASGLARSSSPVPVNLTGDAHLEIVYAASDGQLHAWDYQGNPLPGFPVTFLEGGVEATQSTPAVADVDGDGMLEILFGDESGKVHGYNHDGTELDGFPIQLTGEVRATPSIWDIDGDGQVEVMVQGWDTNVYVWDLPATFDPLRVPWPLFRHDSRNTGWAQVAVLPVGVADPLPPGAAPVAEPRVYAPYPNPFNPRTTIGFDVPGEGARQVEVAIYDVAGRLVRRLLDGAVDSGHHALTWDGRTAGGRRAGSGVYLVRVRIDSFERTAKLVLVE